MATVTENGNGSAAEEAAERKPTERVVLRQVHAIVLPDEITPEQQDAIAAALHTGKGKPRSIPVIVAWEEVARVQGASKTAAIEGYAGKAGTPDAKIGTFRAPSSTAWKGAIVHEAPPAPLVERRVIE